MAVAEKEQGLISYKVQKLRAKHATKQVDPSPDQFLSQISFVPKKGSSQCPVINLKPLNRLLQRQKFKLEGARMIQDLIQRNDWMVTIDLKDAYLSVQWPKSIASSSGLLGETTCLNSSVNHSA